jgi:hypothetical protein
LNHKNSEIAKVTIICLKIQQIVFYCDF